MSFKGFIKSRSFAYGSRSVAITALVITAIIIFNVIFSALAAKFTWYVDLTKEGIYTLSDNCKTLLDNTFENLTAEREKNNEEPLKVKIKFCDLEDNVMENTTQRYVLMTAKELADRYPDIIEIEFINIWENPTAVEKYKTSVLTAIYQTHVIIESGSEYRAYDISRFYLTNSGSTTPWAYFGEKRFTSGILAVTQAESPVAAVLTGHGEIFTDTALIELLDLAGYNVITVKDLLKEELPDECRLMISYNPTADFLDADGISDISEIALIDEFLAGNNHSFMVFMSPTSPTLPVLEKYLELWGISYNRHDGKSTTVKDEDNALTSDGITFMGEYVELGLGGSITKDLRSSSSPRKVVFKNAMPIKFAPEYMPTSIKDNDTGKTLIYGYKDLGSGFTREAYYIFESTEDAVAMSGGSEAFKADANNKFGLMAISRQYKAVQEDNYGISSADHSSYVLACGSTEIVSKAFLESNTYGNSEVFLKVLYEMGKENVPASLSIKPFADTTIDTLTVDRANAYTITLAIIPTVLVFGIGIFVIVRRKYS